MTSKKRDAGWSGSGQTRGAAGRSGAGKPFVPGNLEDSGDAAPKNARPAPSPGVPVSDEKYEVLKRKAKTERAVRSKFSQSDPAD